jgi:hypothetical protein
MKRAKKIVTTLKASLMSKYGKLLHSKAAANTDTEDESSVNSKVSHYKAKFVEVLSLTKSHSVLFKNKAKSELTKIYSEIDGAFNTGQEEQPTVIRVGENIDYPKNDVLSDDYESPLSDTTLARYNAPHADIYKLVPEEVIIDGVMEQDVFYEKEADRD